MSPVESFQKLGINVIKLVDYLQPFSPFAPISNASKDAVLWLNIYREMTIKINSPQIYISWLLGLPADKVWLIFRYLGHSRKNEDQWTLPLSRVAGWDLNGNKCWVFSSLAKFPSCYFSFIHQNIVKLNCYQILIKYSC